MGLAWYSNRKYVFIFNRPNLDMWIERLPNSFVLQKTKPTLRKWIMVSIHKIGLTVFLSLYFYSLRPYLVMTVVKAAFSHLSEICCEGHKNSYMTTTTFMYRSRTRHWKKSYWKYRSNFKEKMLFCAMEIYMNESKCAKETRDITFLSFVDLCNKHTLMWTIDQASKRYFLYRTN